MTNPGDSDEWWKQYGGAGLSPEPGAAGSGAQPTVGGAYEYPSLESTPEPLTEYPSQPAPQPPYPNYQQPQQPQQQQPSPQGGYYGYQQPQQQPYPQGGYYGYQAPAGYQPYGYPNQQGNNGLAIAALVLSLASFTTCGCTGFLGIIVGTMALSQINKNGQRGRGMALGGIWIGVASILLFVAYIVIIFLSEAG